MDLASSVSTDDFLEQSLLQIPESIEENHGPVVTIVLASLYVYLCVNGRIPDNVSVFKDKQTELSNIWKLNEPFDWQSHLILANILMQLQLWGDFESAKDIENIFHQIDYSTFSNSTHDVIGEIISAILLGADYSLLLPILEKKNTDKKIRRDLKELKSWLSQIFSVAPGSYRETIRKILNDLKDIPLPE